MLQEPASTGLALSKLGLVLESTHGCSSTHNNTLQVLQRTSFGPAPHMASPVSRSTIMTSCGTVALMFIGQFSDICGP